MPEAERITASSDACELSMRWRVRQDVMEKFIRGAQQFERETGRPVSIISGYRTPGQQRQLKAKGRPAAQVDLSNHTTCPATAIDARLGFGVTLAMKAIFGRIMTLQGLRWGGGSKVDPETGIPSDWNHLDLGPRSTVSPSH